MSSTSQMSPMTKLLMLCVPVPNTILLRQEFDQEVENFNICRVCLKPENIAEVDEYGRAICTSCILKRSTQTNCLRCDFLITPDLPIILNSQQMCNMCVCADACNTSPFPAGEITSTIIELCKLVKMMRGELPIGKSVTIRPRCIVSELMELDFFRRNGEDNGVLFGEHGIVQSFTTSNPNERSLLSNGTYSILLDSGDVVSVLSASGLRYDGQKIEFRMNLT